jgi:hypothetical protein
MQRTIAAILLYLGLATAALAQVPSGPQPISCNQTFQVSQAAVALTKIVSNVSGKQISICGWALNAGAAAATAQLETGTGTNCGTGTTALTPAISLGINGVYVDHSTFAFQSLARLNDLCLVTTGTGPMQVTVYFGIY